jgi:orotidine-5'-phosphate decarboxylase
MNTRNFRELLENQWARRNFLCVGLDSDYNNEKFPASVKAGGDAAESVRRFNWAIVDATKDLVGAYKPNIAFYEALGEKGWYVLKTTMDYIRTEAPDVPIILDAKRADIGSTNAGYVKGLFDFLKADAITVHPYLGREALAPFLERAEKGIFVLCRTSNPGAGEFQDAWVQTDWSPTGTAPLYQYVAFKIAKDWNGKGNCGLVVGATYPEELRMVRQLAPELPILIPAVGAQGGDLEQAVSVGKDSRNRGFIINSSRGIIFASSGADFAEAARRETEKLRDAINLCLKKEEAS